MERVVGLPTLTQIVLSLSDVDDDSIRQAELDRRKYTRGNIVAKPMGMARAMLLDAETGLSAGTSIERSLKKHFDQRTAVSSLISLATSIIPIPIISASAHVACDAIIERFRPLREPSADSILLLIGSIQSEERLMALRHSVASTDKLMSAIVTCCLSHMNGSNLERNSLFLDCLSRIDNFSPWFRGVCSYLQSMNDCVRGEIHDAIQASRRSLGLLQGTARSDLQLAFRARVAVHQCSHIYTSLLPHQISGSLIHDCKEVISESLMTLGIDNRPDRDTSSVIAQIDQSADEEMTLVRLFSLSLYYLFEAICKHQAVEPPTASFQNNMLVNRELAGLRPYLALVMLTPMASAANLLGTRDIASELYGWANGRHPNPEVNMTRARVHSKPASIEALLLNLSYANFCCQLGRRGNASAGVEAKQILSRLAGLPTAAIDAVEQKPVQRYLKRVQYSLHGDSRAYVASEMVDALSHHLHVGAWFDEIDMQA